MPKLLFKQIASVKYRKCQIKFRIWCSRWRLKLNVTNSKVFHFSEEKRSEGTSFKFTNGNEIIDRVTQYKYLGLYSTNLWIFPRCEEALARSGGRSLAGIILKFKSFKG